MSLGQRIRILMATSWLLTAAGLAVVAWGDPIILEPDHLRLVVFLWICHLAFWVAFLLPMAPLLARLAAGGRAQAGDHALGYLVAGILGFTFVMTACLVYLHRDLGFFSARILAINAVAFLVGLSLAVAAVRILRRIGVPWERFTGKLLFAAGMIVAVGFWGTFMAHSRQTIPTNDSNADRQGIEPASPNGDGREASSRVILLGLDGADWLQIDPRIEKGELPAFRRLRTEGATAVMHTVSPWSPVVWTSIATGMDPSTHSVQYFSESYSAFLDLSLPKLHYNFLEPLVSRIFEKIPITSSSRTSKAIWEILTEHDVPSLVVNWWASYPVDPIEGVNISMFALPWDEVSIPRIERLEPTANKRVHPPEVWPEAVSVMRETANTIPASKQSTTEEKAISPTRAEFWDGRDALARALFDHFRTKEQRFVTLYLQGIDTTSHHYSETLFGRSTDEPQSPHVGPEIIEQKRLMVDAVYRRMDALIADLMASMAPSDVLFVVSDHGWRYDGTTHRLKPDAVFAAFGAPIRAGALDKPVHVFDVTPTILSYLGVPAAQDMPGRLLEEIFKADAGREIERARIATYGARHQAGRLGQGDLDSAEYRAKLKSLGYIQ